jgi:acrylyl-CoA reductase (NADPH)
VMPFILRGVSLLGISSANTPIELRRYIWKKLAAQWAAPQFKAIPVHEVTLENIVPTLEAILARQHIGRTVIKI